MPEPEQLPDLSNLDMGNFQLVDSEPGGAKWQWKDVLPGSASGSNRLVTSLSLPPRTPVEFFMQWSLNADTTLSPAFPTVSDDTGTPVCFGSNGRAEQGCLLYVAAVETRLSWTAEVQVTQWPSLSPSFQMTLEMRAASAPTYRGTTFGGDSPTTDLGAPGFIVRTTGIKAMGTPEPSLGITTDGALFTPFEPSGVLRSRDDGRSWERLGVNGSIVDADAWLWADPDTNRVFRVGLDSLSCPTLVTSDDNGESWTERGLVACGPPHHYEKLTTGPPPAGVRTNGYPNIVYYSASLFGDYLTGGTIVGDTAGVWTTASLDGGATWAAGTLVHPGRRACGGWGGPITVSADGTAYSAAQYCDGIRVAKSSDGGITWQEDAYLDQPGHFGEVLGPSLAADSTGRLYLIHTASAGRAVVHIRNPVPGTWSTAFDITPPGVKATTFTIIHSPLPGVAVAAFAGTSSDPSTWAEPSPTFAPDDAVWHFYAVMLGSGLEGVETRVAYQLTPANDPVQYGCIDRHGGQTSGCRNLGDFIGINDHDGRPFIAFTDGCIRCRDSATSRDGLLMLAVLDGVVTAP